MPTGPKVEVTLDTNSPTTDAHGGKTESWTTVETISKAILMAKKGGERFIAGKDNVMSDYTLYVSGKTANRASRSVSEAQRISYGSRTFDIVFVEDVGQMGNMLKIHLREVV